MPCSVDDEECVPGRLKAGMCEKHYRRQRLHGDTKPRRLDSLSRYQVADLWGCWLWQGPLWRNGYGKTSTKVHGTRLAHRAFFMEHRGPIPEGLDLDHLCRVRRCVNPAHLDPVTRAVNLERGLDAREVCRAGLHDVTELGSLKPGTRQCVECWRRRYRAAGQRYRARR